MGQRVRVLKKRVVEYGDTEAFNYGFYHLTEVFDMLGVDTYILDNESGSDALCEVNAEGLKKGIEYLKGGKLNKRCESVEEIERYVKEEFNKTLDEFVSIIESYMREGDCHNGFYYFRML